MNIASVVKKTKAHNLAQMIAEFVRERDWDKFHTPKNLAMGLVIESAEVMELFQWLTPEESSNLSEAKLDALADELADVNIYLLRLASRFAIDLDQATRRKIQKNAEKYPVDKAKGVAKKYYEL